MSVPSPARPVHLARAARTPAVAGALAARSIVRIYRVPATFLPSVLMPLFFVVAFSGAFAALVALPRFPVDHVIDWMLPMAVLQGSAFAGATTALGLARDLEDGFFDRLLLAPVSRRALVLGPLLAGALRALVPFTLVLTVGLVVGGARLSGGPLGVLTLLAACLGLAVMAGAWGIGLVLRARSQSIAPLIQIAIFVAMFTSTAQVPLVVMTGWLHAVARVNPMTNVLALARAGFVGPVTWAEVWPGLLAMAGGIAALGLFAARGLRRLIP